MIASNTKVKKKPVTELYGLIFRMESMNKMKEFDSSAWWMEINFENFNWLSLQIECHHKICATSSSLRETSFFWSKISSDFLGITNLYTAQKSYIIPIDAHLFNQYIQHYIPPSIPKTQETPLFIMKVILWPVQWTLCI